MRGWICAVCLVGACGRAPVMGQEASTSETSQGAEESGSGGESTDGGMFAPVSDLPPEPMACDPFTQACEPGYKCTYRGSTPGTCCVDEAVCLPVYGNDAPGEPCTALGDDPGLDGLDTCAVGSWCTEIEPNTEVGTCRELCYGEGSDPQCPEGQVCQIYGSPIPALCRDLCDPLDENACPPGEACTDVGAFFCRPVLPPGPTAYGEACSYAYECGPGLVCVLGAVPGCEDGCCTAYCDLDQPNDCPDIDQGQLCQPLPGGAPEGLEHVGRCGMP